MSEVSLGSYCLPSQSDSKFRNIPIRREKKTYLSFRVLFFSLEFVVGRKKERLLVVGDLGRLGQASSSCAAGGGSPSAGRSRGRGAARRSAGGPASGPDAAGGGGPPAAAGSSAAAFAREGGAVAVGASSSGGGAVAVGAVAPVAAACNEGKLSHRQFSHWKAIIQLAVEKFRHL